MCTMYKITKARTEARHARAKLQTGHSPMLQTAAHVMYMRRYRRKINIMTAAVAGVTTLVVIACYYAGWAL